jgi:hypothetical protein
MKLLMFLNISVEYRFLLFQIFDLIHSIDLVSLYPTQSGLQFASFLALTYLYILKQIFIKVYNIERDLLLARI